VIVGIATPIAALQEPATLTDIPVWATRREQTVIQEVVPLDLVTIVVVHFQPVNPVSVEPNVRKLVLRMVIQPQTSRAAVNVTQEAFVRPAVG